MARTPRLEPGPDQARKARTLRAAARTLDHFDTDDGRNEPLADLLDAIATACEHVHRAPLISLDEGLRWGGVVNTALMIAREIDKGATG